MTEFYQSALELVEADNHDHLIQVVSANATQLLGHIRNSDEILFNYGCRIFSGWSERYFHMLHSNELVNELEEDIVEEQEDSDAAIVRVQSRLHFQSTDLSGVYLASEIKTLICEIYSINSQESLRIQTSLQHFGLLDGNSTICSLYDSPSFPIHPTDNSEENGGEESSSGAESLEEPLSIDEIYSEEGEEDEIFTYTYNYSNDSE